MDLRYIMKSTYIFSWGDLDGWGIFSTLYLFMWVLCERESVILWECVSEWMMVICKGSNTDYVTGVVGV